MEIKAGVIDGQYYDAAGVGVIAQLPSRDELIAKLLGSFQAPVSSFARVVQAIADQKADGAQPEGEAAPAEEAPAQEEAQAPAQEGEEATPEA